MESRFAFFVVIYYYTVDVLPVSITIFSPAGQAARSVPDQRILASSWFE